ncbi:MAG: hydantoinase/oxoprolinase family protein [Myxococcota bacterium]
MRTPGHRIGVDIGGTFTDAVVVAPDGRLAIGKVSTTPPDFATGFFGAIDAAAARLGLDARGLLSATRSLAHGTTVGINALVTGDVARVGLLATKGHGDAIRIMGGGGRVLGASLEELLDYQRSSRADPVVPRERVFELDERIDRDGRVVVALSDAAIDRAVDRLIAAGVESVAVALLFSFANPTHEERTLARIRARCPGLFVCASHEVAPRIGEYPRMVSTVLNAQIGPLMRGYIEEIVRGARERGFAGEVLFGQSEGGLSTAEQASRFPLTTLQSGPVAGVVGSARAGREMGQPNVVVTDMGGTTLDVATIEAGRVAYRYENEVVRQLAYLRKVDVESVGAGGGSIAWIHAQSGSLRVGPRSAGARPGPICYGRGGREPTVTDADLMLGILSPERPLADGLRLDLAAAEKALDELGARLGLSAEACAAGIVEIVDSRMEDLVRRMTVQRGADPRDFVLWAFGGASGAHAGLYGRGIGVREIVFPMGDAASVWSAYGLTRLDPACTYEASVALRTPLDATALAGGFATLEARARAHAKIARFESPVVLRRVGMRYPLQVHEVEIDCPEGPVDARFGERLVERFHRAYEGRYGAGAAYADAGAEITSLRVVMRSRTERRPLAPAPAVDHRAEPVGQRGVYWRELAARVETPLYEGAALAPGAALDGPGIVEFPHTTIAVRPGQGLRCDGFGNLILRLAERPVDGATAARAERSVHGGPRRDGASVGATGRGAAT